MDVSKFNIFWNPGEEGTARDDDVLDVRADDWKFRALQVPPCAFCFLLLLL